MKYSKKSINQIAFPLGGIGAGSISLSGNGQLIDWSIFNRPNVGSENYFTHIALRAFTAEKVKDARVLISDIQENYNPAGCGSSVNSMNGFPHFKKNSFVGEFPFCSLEFEEDKFPAKVKLDAFSPFIPLDSKNSSLPAACFEVVFENTTNETLDYEAAFSLRNPFDKSLNKKISRGISLCGAGRNNSLTLITDSEKMHTVDYWYRGWFNNFCRDNIRMFWDSFSSGKYLEDKGYTESSNGDMCTVSGRVSLSPGERGTVRFILTWHVPECYNYWYPIKTNEGLDVTWKNYYATVFENSEESASYFLKNLDYLKKKSSDFRDCLKSTTVDESVKSAVEAGLAVLKSPTVMRLEDGSFYGFEGSAPGDGSCEGICQHVYNYAYAMCYLFPDLEMSIRNNELKYGVLKSGESLIRLSLPFGRKEFVNSLEPGKKFIPCVDGHMGTIIKIYREWKLSGDSEWLKKNYKTVSSMLSFIWSCENDQHWDESKSGVLRGRQHHTLDLELFGPSGWLQGFYLVALRAAEEMAKFVGDTESATLYRAIFEKGYRYTKENLFNGEYFIQQIDLSDRSTVEKFDLTGRYWNDYIGEITHQLGEGCLIDQLIGAWHAELNGLGEIFDSEQAKRAAYSIFKNNYKESMRDIVNPWRLFAFNDDGGTVICSYPEKCKKPKIPILYSEEVMSGFEYAFAGILAIYGFIDESLDVVRIARKRYDGERRNPWNDSECGNYYARSMSSYALISIYSGFSADLPRKHYGFIPRANERPFRSIFSMGTGWGEFTVADNSVKILLKSGYIAVSSISIPEGYRVLRLIVDGNRTPYKQHNNTVFFDACAKEEILFEVLKNEA